MKYTWKIFYFLNKNLFVKYIFLQLWISLLTLASLSKFVYLFPDFKKQPVDCFLVGITLSYLKKIFILKNVVTEKNILANIVESFSAEFLKIHSSNVTQHRCIPEVI